MHQLSTIFILILASTNASKYFRQDQQFQQDPLSKVKYQELLALALSDDRFYPKFSIPEVLGKWESPPEPRTIFDLDSLENYLQDDSNDYRMKRTKTSLSIDNPLDVLRQQYYRALARRMKFKSIEKNREHLLKTGKRSPKEFEYRSEVDNKSKNGSKEEFLGTEERVGSSQADGNDQTPTMRRFQNRLDDLSFQT